MLCLSVRAVDGTFLPWKPDGTSTTETASVSGTASTDAGARRGGGGRAGGSAQSPPIPPSTPRRCWGASSRAPAHTETRIFYGESRPNYCCLQLGNLLGKPDTSAWFSELPEHARSSAVPPGSAEFKGSRPRVKLDPINAANFIFS